MSGPEPSDPRAGSVLFVTNDAGYPGGAGQPGLAEARRISFHQRMR
jgi:hypothetical protein